MIRECSAILLLTLAVFAAGCSGGGHQQQTVRVSGTVTVDGAPLPAGAITFTPESGRVAQGVINSDGAFQLGTYGKADGAVVGLHRVAILAYEDMDAYYKAVNFGSEAGNISLPKSLLPTKYQSSASSGLTFEVKAGQKNQADFNLTTKAENAR